MPRSSGLRAAGGAELIELGAAQRRERAAILAEQIGHGERVVAGGHERGAAAEQIGEGAVFR